MAELTPDGVVCNYFLCAREMAKLHGLVRELRMPLFTRNDMVQMAVSQSFVTILEVVAGDDLSCFDFLSFLMFQLVDVIWLAIIIFWFV